MGISEGMVQTRACPVGMDGSIWRPSLLWRINPCIHERERERHRPRLGLLFWDGLLLSRAILLYSGTKRTKGRVAWNHRDHTETNRRNASKPDQLTARVCVNSSQHAGGVVRGALRLLRGSSHLYAVQTNLLAIASYSPLSLFFFFPYVLRCMFFSSPSLLSRPTIDHVAGCLTLWCPCVTFGRTAEIVDRGSTCTRSTSLPYYYCPPRLVSISPVPFGWRSVPHCIFAACCMSGTLYYLLSTIGWQWLYGCAKRSSMRSQYSLRESPCMDCCVHFWCGPCALCQEYTELQKRGFHMAKGISSPPSSHSLTRRPLMVPWSPCLYKTIIFLLFAGWEGSNKVVGCFHGMTTPPRKQSMCF